MHTGRTREPSKQEPLSRGLYRLLQPLPAVLLHPSDDSDILPFVRTSFSFPGCRYHAHPLGPVQRVPVDDLVSLMGTLHQMPKQSQIAELLTLLDGGLSSSSSPPSSSPSSLPAATSANLGGDSANGLLQSSSSSSSSSNYQPLASGGDGLKASAAELGGFGAGEGGQRAKRPRVETGT